MKDNKTKDYQKKDYNTEKKTMKNYTAIILSIVIGIMSHSINAQEKQKKTMEQFDYEKFTELKDMEGKKSEYSFFTSDSTEVIYNEYSDIFFEKKILYNSKYRTTKQFYKNNNRSLKREGQYFDQIPYGIHKFYNEQGELTKEINYDSLFPFTVPMVIDLLKNSFNVDITDLQLKTYCESTIDPSPQYLIEYKFEEGRKSRRFLISGVSGEILSDYTYFNKED